MCLRLGGVSPDESPLNTSTCSSSQACPSKKRFASVTPSMLPVLSKVMTVINQNINHEKLKKHGKNMIKVALDKLDDDDLTAQLFQSFKAIHRKYETSAQIREDLLANIVQELIKKIFHSRVNEYMEARKELDLEVMGKTTDAEQSLRDTLKTYSNNTSRPVLST